MNIAAPRRRGKLRGDTEGKIKAYITFLFWPPGPSHARIQGGGSMLIVTRRIGERIMIGSDVTVTVLGVKGNNHVRLGVEAPKSVAVHREEIFERIKHEHDAERDE